MFAAIFYLLVLVPFSIAAFLATIDIGLGVGAAVFVVGLALLNALAAKYGPVEAKTKWWQP